MLVSFIKKYGRFFLVGVFFFYLGCSVTLNFLKIDCVDFVKNIQKIDNIASHSKENGVLANDHRTEYAILVLTSPKNEARRNAIRNTWGKLVNNIRAENGEKSYSWYQNGKGQESTESFIKVYFAVGTQSLDDLSLAKLRTEQTKIRDLVLLDDVVDSYRNLTLKVLQAFKWLSQNLKELKYVIKVDDDSFVRVDLIVKDVEDFAPKMNAATIQEYVSFKNNLSVYKGLYWGYFNGRAKVYFKGKWEEKQWFLCDHYLPYALGGGYVISRTIVDYIARNEDFLTLYHSEDVSMGVWTAALDGINRVHDVRFDTEWTSRGCRDNLLVRHKQTPNEMIQMYQTLIKSNGKRLCDKESQLRKSYLYNWTVLPSGCCNTYV